MSTTISPGDASTDYLAVAWRGECASAEDAWPVRGRFLSNGLPLFRQQGAGAMAGVVNLIARRPTAEPIREFLFNQTTLGGTDASGFYGKQFSRHWGMTLLGSGDWQERKDRDHDGWADLAGYGRGLVRPRFIGTTGTATRRC